MILIEERKFYIYEDNMYDSIDEVKDAVESSISVVLIEELPDFTMEQKEAVFNMLVKRKSDLLDLLNVKISPEKSDGLSTRENILDT